MTGHGGWPLNAFLTPDRRPVLCRHLLPARVPPRAAELADGARRRRRGLVGAPRSRSAPGRADGRRRWARPRGSSRRSSRSPTTLVRAALVSLWSTYDRANGGFGRAPKFPQASVIEFLLARGEREMSLETLRGDGPRRDLRPGRRRLCPLRGRRDLDRARTSRRCSTTTRCWPAPTCTAGRCRETSASERSAARRSTGRCARCAAPKAASARRSTPTPRASRASSTCGRVDELRDVLGPAGLADEAIAYFGATERGNFEHWAQRPRGARARAGGAARDPRAAARRRARPRPPGARRQAADLVERADDLGAGRGRRRARARGLPRRGRRAARRSCCGAARRRRAPAAHAGRTVAAHLDAYLEDHAFLLEALLTLYEATFDPRWYREAIALADAMIERFADPERGGFFTTAVGPRAARRPGARTSRTPRSRRATRRPRSGCCGWRCCRARAATSATRSACCGCCSRSPRATRWRSATCCGARLLPGAGPGGGDRRPRARGRRAAPRRPRVTTGRTWCSPAGHGRRRAAARGPRAGRGPRRRVRVRALRLPGAGHRRPTSSRRPCQVARAPAGSARAPTG